MTTYNLSFIISTKNRLHFLKIILSKLIPQLQPDEEIVVVDSNSTDGTKEYLEQLLKEEKIHQFISEPDKNQAHGWNKALLMAKGTIIKKIIDDDVFCYEAIRKCKDYMLNDQAVDVIISNDLGSSINTPNLIDKYTRLPQFKKWHNGSAPSFTFGDVHMLIRRSSLAYIGLYNTSYINMDWEYSLRISYLKAKIAYYTGYNALSVMHPQTISFLRDEKNIKDQGKRGAIFYNYIGDDADITKWSKIKIFIGRLIFREKKATSKVIEASNLEDLKVAYDYFYAYISDINDSEAFTFLN